MPTNTKTIARSPKRSNCTTSKRTRAVAAPSPEPSTIETRPAPLTEEDRFNLRALRNQREERDAFPELGDIDTARDNLSATAVSLCRVAGVAVCVHEDDDQGDLARTLMQAMADLASVASNVESLYRRTNDHRIAWRDGRAIPYVRLDEKAVSP